jgi:hypothetical protein
MEAFREASKLYRHIFYQMFRHELTNCHERAEALAQLWFSIDQFLLQVGPTEHLGPEVENSGHLERIN